MRLLGRYLNSQTEARKVTQLLKRAASERVERIFPTTARWPVRLTKDQNAKIAALYAAGHRPVDIARQLGTTEWTVHHRLNRQGVERRPTSMTNTEIEEARRLHEQGVPITELAKQFNRSWKTIRKELYRDRDR